MTELTAPPLVALFGAGRNGGTLFARLLDGSPELWVHPVDVLYASVWDDLARHGRITFRTQQNATARRLRELGARLPTRLVIDQFAQHWRDIEESYVPLLADPLPEGPDPRAALEESATYTAGEFLPAFLEATRLAYDHRGGAPRALVFKSVETPYVEDYLRLFPGLRCLHLVRDPVANYASTKRSWSQGKARPFYWGGFDLLSIFLDARWLPHVRAALALVEADPDNHLFVRYEDLCADPVAVIGGVCAWLGVAPPAEPEEQTALGGRRLTAMPVHPAPSQPGVATPQHVVSDMASRFDYGQVVTPREREFIALRTAPLAQQLGYTVEGPNGWGERLRLFVRWLRPDASERLHVRRRSRWALEVIRRRLYIGSKLVARR